MEMRIKRYIAYLCAILAVTLLPQNVIAGAEHNPNYTGTVVAMSDSPDAATNPCAAKNPCAANPCAAKNPCAANPCAAKNPCAANPCAANPCAAKNPCAANPCGAKNPCAANPCAANPCAAAAGVDSKLVTRPTNIKPWSGSDAELAVLGKKLWSDTSVSSNGLSCNTCHQNNGAFSASFKKPYPHTVKMATDQAGLQTIALDEMVQLCLVVPMATKPMAWDSKELAALTAYTAVVQKSFQMSMMNPCAAKNPCAANPCAAKNPCGVNPCAANPCGAKNPCAANPCAAKNPCAK